MRTRDIIIDTDPGIDDAAAITLAIRNEYLNVKLISTVAANVEVEKTTKNALKLVEFVRSRFLKNWQLVLKLWEKVAWMDTIFLQLLENR